MTKLLLDQADQTSIKEFIMLMLGAPILKLELDDTQVDMCVRRTCDFMNASNKVADWSDTLRLMVAQEGSLAQVKMILGRIRTKYVLDAKGVNSKSKSSTILGPLDGNLLLLEGERQYLEWQRKVFGEISDKK